MGPTLISAALQNLENRALGTTAIALLAAAGLLPPASASDGNRFAYSEHMANGANKTCTADKSAVVVRSDFRQVVSKAGTCQVGQLQRRHRMPIGRSVPR